MAKNTINLNNNYPINVFDACKTLCHFSDWTITNLKVHKILYLAQVYHVGRYQQRIFQNDFEARAMGANYS